MNPTNLKYDFSDGTRKGGFMSRARMVYCLGGESLNDVKKSDRYKAPEIQLFDPTGENLSDDYFAPAPGPTPQRPQPPNYLRNKNGKRRRLNPPDEEPGPSSMPVPVPSDPAPSRVSGRIRKKTTRLIEE